MNKTLTATTAVLIAGIVLAPAASASQSAASQNCNRAGSVVGLDLTGYEYDGDDTNTMRVVLDGTAATMSFGRELHYSSGRQLDPSTAHVATFRVTTHEAGSKAVTQVYLTRVQACVR